mgnify:FL=1
MSDRSLSGEHDFQNNLLVLFDIVEVIVLLSVELKILICFVWAFIVFFITALIIGNEGKAKWFQRRTKYTWFNRRGFLGEALFFGYPKTKEGYGITFLMASAITIVGYILYLI